MIDLIHKTMTAKWQAEGHGKKKIEKLWNAYVPEHLLPRLHGYELMMAPYAIAHMKIGLKLYETGYRFESDERAFSPMRWNRRRTCQARWLCDPRVGTKRRQ